MRAETVSAVAETATALLAGWALLSSIRVYRASYQPIVRPVVARDPVGLILKNVGRGAALSVTVAPKPAESEADVVTDVDVIEPLGAPYGPKFKEVSRIGRVWKKQRGRQLEAGRSYRIFYQDAAGAWHETDFTVSVGESRAFEFETKFRGRCSVWKLRPVPAWIQARGQVAAEDISPR